MHFQIYQRVIEVNIQEAELPLIYGFYQLFCKKTEKLKSSWVFELRG